jgi:hypothetical protein
MMYDQRFKINDLKTAFTKGFWWSGKMDIRSTKNIEHQKSNIVNRKYPLTTFR